MFVRLLCVCACIAAALCSGEKSGKSERRCEEIAVHGKPHTKHVLSMGLNRPYQLAFDRHHRRLFFSHNVGPDDEDAFEIGYVEEGKMVPEVVDSVKNGFAIAVADAVIYYGGSDGIYAQHLTGNATNATVHEVLREHNVWDMFYKNSLYFITYPLQHLYKVAGGKAERQQMHEKIYQFVIDGDDDVFITNDTGLFLIRNATDERVAVRGPKVYRAVEVSNAGAAYFCGGNGIYVANKRNASLELVAPLRHTFGVAFDGHDNIIYSDSHEIVKLVPGTCK